MTVPGPDASYDLHRKMYDDRLAAGTIDAQPSYLNPRDTSGWQHRNALSLMDVILQQHPGAFWVTVGDGRYGSEARYIQDHGGRAVATDIADTLLKRATEAGWIDAYEVQNAERMTMADCSCDFVCCKESAHHFPRPYAAIYEMLRIARQGVVLIEPSDPYGCDRMRQRPLTHLRRWVNRLLNGRNGRNDFEPVGNYLYKFSIRDFEKLALGLALPALAYAGVNAFHVFPMDDRDRTWSRWLRARLVPAAHFLVVAQDILVRLSILQPVMYAVILFVKAPSADLIARMQKSGYRFMNLPRNPYAPKDEHP